MKRLLLASAILLAAYAASPLLRAQETPKPGPEHELLKEHEGVWDTVMTVAGPDAKPEKGTHTYKLECGGLWLTSKFEGQFGGMKFEGRGLDGYDTFKKKYTGVWVDSMGTAPMLMEGDYDAKTKTMTMTGEYPGPDGKPAKFKNVTVTKDKDHHTFKMYMTAGDKEELAFTIEYTRRK